MILVPIDVPARVIDEPDNLPADWNGLPYSAGAREVGDLWVGSRASAALLVPSVVLPAERNLLINPAHRAFRQVRVLPAEPFAFDRRLLR